jgi:SAM-dependent methyltransferase
MLDVITKAQYFACLDAGHGDPNVATLKGIQDAWMLSMTDGLEGRRVLEVGGGWSRVLPALAARNECFNLDRFEGAGGGPANVAEQPGIGVVLGYMGEFSPDLEPESFDVVLSVSVLEHVKIDDLGRVFADIYRCLRPGGVAFHAIDHWLACEPFAYADARLDGYVAAVEATRLEWLEERRVSAGLTFRPEFASAPDVHLRNAWRNDPAVARLVLDHQVVSLRLGCTRPASDRT